MTATGSVTRAHRRSVVVTGSLPGAASPLPALTPVRDLSVGQFALLALHIGQQIRHGDWLANDL